MKVTIYTITDCPFSKQEKEYLTSHNIQFEEKNLETNKEFLTEMLTVSNNFAGTPVTKIDKDDGQIAVLKGFTQAEFDQTLNLAPAPSDAPAQTPTTPPAVEPQPVAEAPVVNDVQKVVNELAAQGSDLPQPPVPGEPSAPPEPIPTRPPEEPSQPVVNNTVTAAAPTMPSLDTPPTDVPTPQAPQPTVEEPVMPPANDKLNSILASLQQKVDTNQTPPPAPFAGQPAAPSAPTIPDFH